MKELFTAKAVLTPRLKRLPQMVAPTVCLPSATQSEANKERVSLDYLYPAFGTLRDLSTLDLTDTRGRRMVWIMCP